MSKGRRNRVVRGDKKKGDEREGGKWGEWESKKGMWRERGREEKLKKTERKKMNAA